MQDLILQYKETLARLEQRHSELRDLLGSEYFQAQKRLHAIEDEQDDVSRTLAYILSRML